MARANAALHFTKKCYYYKYHALLVKKSGSMKKVWTQKIPFSFRSIYSLYNLKRFTMMN